MRLFTLLKFQEEIIEDETKINEHEMSFVNISIPNTNWEFIKSRQFVNTYMMKLGNEMYRVEQITRYKKIK